MTWPGRVGDEGQRYQVEGKLRSGEWEVMGWTTKEDGGNLLESAKLWPRYVEARVIDREKPKP